MRTTLRRVADAGPLRITYTFRRAAFLRAVLGLVLALGFGAGLGACAASAAEVRKAKNSGYNTDFSTVYGEALAAVVKLYPRTSENAVDGVIRTAWHRVAVQTGTRNGNQQNQTLAGQNPQAQGLTSTSAANRKLFFIRLRVHVVGGKPWRVRVTGDASVISAGDHPMPLRGAETPPWLKGRIDAMRVAIHKRLKKYAVQVEQEIPKAEGTVITIDEPTGFGDIPKEAEETLMELHRGLSLRSMPDIRAQLAEDVQWSEGAEGSAEVAMVMWQADTSILEAMLAVLGRGCKTGDGDVTVSCPEAYSMEPDYRGYRLILEKRGKRWLVTAFVKSE